jgi:anthranilate synthase component II
MIGIIDDHGAFTGSLQQCFATLGVRCEVHDHRTVTAETLAARPLIGLVLTCGPGALAASAVSFAAIRGFAARTPVLGIGPGHEALAGAYGATLAPAQRLLHGATSPVLHRGRGLFAGIENPFVAGRYHAQVVERDSLPDALEVTAWTPTGEIMGLRHRDHESWGVQFPPQSILTCPGLKLVENFLSLCRQPREVPQ